MSKKYQIVRKCKNCPTWTQIVCHYAFGVYWCVKSGDGEGCKYPLDDVAEQWRKGGWTPDKGTTKKIVLPPKDVHPKQNNLKQAKLQMLTDDDY